MTTKIALFKGKEIRKTIHKNEWWFSVIDIIEALTDTERPRKYWNDLKKKLTDEGYFEVSEKIGQLKLMAPDGIIFLASGEYRSNNYQKICPCLINCRE